MMPDDDKKKTTAQIVTGSTGNAMVDAPPRVLLVTFAGGLATALCLAFGADAALTGALVTTSSAGAGIAAVLFDGLIKPRL
jgi:trans-2-enoyl-CoA reductase